MRSILSSGIGGRPPVSLPFGYAGSIAFASSAHGMIRSMSARNAARRVVFPNFSNPLSVCCFIRSVLLRAILHQTPRVFQSFPNYLYGVPRQVRRGMDRED